MKGNHPELEDLFQTALSDFQKGNYRPALLRLVSLYQDGYRRDEIKEILDEASYEPNEAEIKAIYSANTALLANYPYLLGWEALAYEEIPVIPYMVSETEFYLFDRRRMEFTHPYQSAGSDPAFDCCLKHFDQQRCFFNETSFDKIVYLCRNIRKSENLGLENHIYLNYDSVEEFLPLVLLHDLTPVLAEQKLVIAIGQDHKMEPERFSEVFGVTYNKADAKELTLEEIQRMIFGWKITNVSGTSFLADIMDFHPNLLTISDCKFNDFYPYYLKFLKDKTAAEAISFLRAFPDQSEEKALFYRITHVLDKGLPEDTYREANRVSIDQLLDGILHLLPNDKTPTPSEWVTGIYLAYANCHDRELNTRIIPAVFMYPHDDMFYLAGMDRARVEFYWDLVCSYPDYKVIAMIRDPVTQAGSVTRFMLEGHPMAKDSNGNHRLDPFYCMAFGALLPKDYLFPNEHPMRRYTSVVRFEDLKLNPEATLESLTDYLDLPVSDTLYRTTCCGYRQNAVATDGTVFEGFDVKPLYNQHSQYLSIFDKYRIELLMYDLMRHYGYEPLYYEGEIFSSEQIYALFQLPFRCDGIKNTMSTEQRAQSRNAGMNLIQMAIAVNSLQEKDALKISGLPYTFSFLPWLRPNEQLLKDPVYKTRRYPALEDFNGSR